MDLFYYFLFWICVLGLCLGSFYNVVILRSLSNESIVFPASKCPKCNHKLYAWHNIPVLSYILLRGKCYFCKEKISIQYPIIEILTMLLFAFTYIKFGLSIKTIFSLIWISGFLIMTVTDIKERVADCNIAIGLTISGIIYNSITFGKDGFIYSLFGIVIGIIILESIARLGYLFTNTRAMGEADTYVAAALGAIFTFQHIMQALMYSFIVSMLLIIPMFLYNQYKNNNKTTCVLSILFILSILIQKYMNDNVILLIPVFLFAICLIINILKNIKNKKNHHYLPYIPAFAIGFLYLLYTI